MPLCDPQQHLVTFSNFKLAEKHYPPTTCREPSFLYSCEFRPSRTPSSALSSLNLSFYCCCRVSFHNLRASILIGKHGNSRSEPKATTQQPSSSPSSTLSRAFSQAGVNRTSQPAQQQHHQPELPSSAQLTHNEKKPAVRARVPAVTSKARTTAPERKDARRNRRKYPRWVSPA